MELKYTNEIITNPDGIDCHVLDVSSLDFSNAREGRKKKTTIVMRAIDNECINTYNSMGLVESTYIAKDGEAIFYNSDTDMYVPRDENGVALSFQNISEHGYDIVGDSFQFNGRSAIRVRNNNIAKLLPEVIVIPTCIKDKWGKGSHQFLFEGATLKKDILTGKISGIDKEAFDETWEIFKNEKRL